MIGQRIAIDPTRPLAAEPHTGHNRWHPDIAPILRVRPGDRIVLETRDALDGQAHAKATAADVLKTNLNVVHPLTGPVYIDGAKPGDLLEVHIVDVEPDRYGFTVQIPGFGFLREYFPEPYIAKWQIADGYAESPDIPGVRIPGASFPGTIGIAPSMEQLRRFAAREQRLLERGGMVLPPDPTDAVPADERIAREALRTVPPRETAGNVDVKQLARGVRLFIPVSVEGALFSLGDAHFAQGDGEACGTAIEIRAAFHLEFAVHSGAAKQRRVAAPTFSRDDYAQPPEIATPKRFYATTGISIRDDGENIAEDATLSAKRALLAMIDHLEYERGYTRQQAYAICSVAVDLKLSELVDVPNFVVSAFLPLDIFV